MAIFIVFSVIYLITLFFKQGIFQAVMKSCLMPLLVLMYIFGAENIFWLIIAALLLGCAGDIFLLRIKDLRFFRLGLVSFLLGHVCYIAALVIFARPFNLTVLAVSLVVAIALEYFMVKFVNPVKEMKIPVIVYGAIIMGMVIFTLQVFLKHGSPSGSFILAGGLCFLVSDSALARFTFGTKPKYGDFIVMITYIAAQFFITLGFCGL